MVPVDENLQVVFLVQALIGAITPNFRRVNLEWTPPSTVCLWFLLEQDDPADREEVEDIAAEFFAYQIEGIELSVEVLVDARPFPQIKLPGRAVFGRKEE